MKTTSHDNQKLEKQLAAQNGLADSYEIPDTYLRDILMQVPVSIVSFKGPAFIVDMINQKALEMWSIAYNDIINKPLFEILPELREQDTEKILTRVYTTGEPHIANEVATRYTRDGKTWEGFFNFVVKPVHDLNGAVIGITSISTDVTRDVTTRKAIADTEKRFNLIMMQSPFAFAIFKGKDMVIDRANDSMKQVLGKGNDIEGKPLLDVLPELADQEFPGYLENVYTTGKPLHLNEALAKLQRNGRMEDAYFNFVYQPYREADESISGITVIAYEVTNEVLAKKVIEESEKSLAKLAAIIQFSEDAIVSKTLEGIVTSWNPGAQKLFGYTAEEMIGQSITKVIPKDRLNEEPDILGRIQRGEIVEHFETKRLTKDGNLVDISLTISPVKDISGKITGASKIARDISKAKKAEALLRESERQFRQMADSMPQIVWTAAPNGHIDYYNRQWYEFTGFEEHHSDLSWAQILHPDDVQISIEKYHHSIKSGGPYQVEYRFKDREKPGTFRWFMGRANPLRDEQGNIVKWFGTFTEIDDAKRIQQELELGKQQREDFIKMASHELKTPITTIKGYIQLVLNVVKDEEKGISPLLVKSSLVTMDKQVSRLTRLMSELLDLSRIEAGQLDLKKESFSLNELVIEIVQDVLYTNNKFSINIFHDFECTVHADRDRIGQVLTNFLTNAIKYSPDTDKIEVKIFKPEKNWAAVSVKDRGIGIAENDQEKIFERYYRAEGKSEQTYPGFGVGLFIAGEIIQRHKGKISVESKIGVGSTFTFTIPVE